MSPISVLALLALLIAVYAMTAERLEGLNITGPMVFLVAGIAVNLPSFSLVEPNAMSEMVRTTAVATLTLLLFADASTIDLGALRRNAGFPARLLLVGLPLTIIVGAVLARALMPELGLGMAFLLAALLAPTDLSLGLAMFANPDVPNRVRRSINVESGLNDGIATPLVAIGIAVTVAEFDESSAPLIEAMRELGVGVLVGVAVGLAGGWLVSWSRRRGWSSAHSRQFAAFALAVMAYAGALAVHGNGFIAAFVGGLSFGAVLRSDAVESAEFTEQTGTLLSLAVWFFFGTSLRPALVEAGLAWQPILYALLSLTVIRMLPVTISLLGAHLRAETHVFVGWFGPRGLASVVFLLQSLAVLDSANIDTALIAATASWTILGSVVLHGASAGPVAAWYSRRISTFAAGSPELAPSEAPRTRQGLTRPASVERTR